MIAVTRFQLEHLAGFPDSPLPTLPKMVGYTVWSGDRVLACGGTAPCEWGQELWIYVRDDLTQGQRITVARIARARVRSALEANGELHACARRGNERWLRWLGLHLVEVLVDDNLREIRRWKAEAAWVSRRHSSSRR